MNIEKPEPNWSFLDQLDWNPCFLFKEPWSSSRGFGGGGCCGGCCCLGARHRRGYPRRDMKLEGVQCSCQVQPTVTYNSSSPLMQAGPVPGDKGLKDVSSFGQWPRSSKALLKNPIVLSHVVTYTPCLHIFGFARIFHLYQMIYHLAAFRTCYSQVTWVRSNSFFTSLKQLIQTTTWLGSSHSSYSSGISLGVSFDGQSGYTRSADDPLLALTELSLSEKKCFFAFLGDLSLPFTWGEDMLLLDANCPNFTGGQLHLVGDILSFDVVRVCLGGKSTVIVKQGLPEGGCLGPLLYWYEYCGIVVVVYASVFLSQMLGKSKPGLAEVFHKMNGLQEFLTDSSLAVQHLPVSAALRGNQQNLEALAARALDPIRVLMTMFLLPHLGAKCVEWFSFLNAGLLRTGIAGQNVFFLYWWLGPILPVFLRPSVFSLPIQVCLCTSSHRWLGRKWTSTDATLKQRTITASAHFATLAGLCLANAVPLPLALCLFESKVDGSLAPGRWLYTVLAPNAQQQLDELYYISVGLVCCSACRHRSQHTLLVWN